MSNFAHNDKADQFRMSQLKEEFERMVKELKQENEKFKTENAEYIEEIKNLKISVTEHVSKTET